ncbi:ABC-type transport auxiliary lipoprotein family protein [Desulfonatronospira sp.]|uniref:ABC-type transport auxiliary lipoprotein family protein n=1 Tax=Desulfonatronospira sp. TaxID=1962951 RepID=UPI0025B94C4D|nr:ABC-type transport auxiliary lipoprotein family protein [Desulfonatronospira sp.]
MFKDHKLILCLLCLLLLAAAACAPKKKPPDRNFFVLETKRQTDPVRDEPQGILSVRGFDVSAGFRGKEIVYRTDRGRSQSDFYNQYFISPGPMLTDLTRQWLEDSGMFEAVIPMGSHKKADYILEGAVTSLYGDFQNRGEPASVLRMQLLLLEDDRQDYRMLMHRTYQERVTLNGSGAEHVVQGLNKALTRILTRLEKDMAATLKNNIDLQVP